MAKRPTVSDEDGQYDHQVDQGDVTRQFIPGVGYLENVEDYKPTEKEIEENRARIGSPEVVVVPPFEIPEETKTDEQRTEQSRKD